MVKGGGSETSQWGKKQVSYSLKKMLSEADRITLKYNVEKRDKYNRILAYVYAESKKRVGGAFEKGISLHLPK